MIPSPQPPIMLPSEIAQRLGITRETFWRVRHRYILCEGMPRPISRSGPQRYPRAEMEAWLVRRLRRVA